MAGLNEVKLIGYLGQDPEVRRTQGGTPVAHLSVATTRKWKNKDESDGEETEWHRVTVWGKQADNCAKYLSKGSMIYVDGRLATHKYTDDKGIERWSTQVVARSVQFLDRKGNGGRRDEPPIPPPGESYDYQPPPPGDDDIPY